MHHIKNNNKCITSNSGIILFAYKYMSLEIRISLDLLDDKFFYVLSR